MENAPDNTCAVCLDQVEPSHDKRQLGCMHMFHSRCLGKWVNKGGTCPSCRANAEGCEDVTVFMRRTAALAMEVTANAHQCDVAIEICERKADHCDEVIDAAHMEITTKIQVAESFAEDARSSRSYAAISADQCHAGVRVVNARADDVHREAVQVHRGTMQFDRRRKRLRAALDDSDDDGNGGGLAAASSDVPATPVTYAMILIIEAVTRRSMTVKLSPHTRLVDLPGLLQFSGYMHIDVWKSVATIEGDHFRTKEDTWKDDRVFDVS